MCSRHFKNSRLRKLHSDEYPTENLPRLATRATTSTPRRPLVRRQLVEDERDDDDTGDNDRVEPPPTQDIGVNTVGDEIERLEAKIHDLEDEIKVLTESDRSRFSLESIANDDTKVMFYTGFPSYDHLKIFFDFLGPATKQLIYRDSKRVFDQSNKGHPRSLPPMEEFFLTLVRLRLGKNSPIPSLSCRPDLSSSLAGSLHE